MKAFVRPQVAVDYLRDVGFSIGKDTLQLGLQQRVFPFGDYIKACLLYTSDAADE